MPRMPFIGVRISWLMEARKRDLALLAPSAWSRASASASSAARCSVMSWPTLWISLRRPSRSVMAKVSHTNQRGPWLRGELEDLGSAAPSPPDGGSSPVAAAHRQA